MAARAKRRQSIMEVLANTRPTSVIDRNLSKIEKEEDGGLGICGCHVPAYCYAILLVMAAFFLTGGTVLTAIAFRPMEQDGDEKEMGDREVIEFNFYTHYFMRVSPIFTVCQFGHPNHRPAVHPVRSGHVLPGHHPLPDQLEDGPGGPGA